MQARARHCGRGQAARVIISAAGAAVTHLLRVHLLHRGAEVYRQRLHDQVGHAELCYCNELHHLLDGQAAPRLALNDAEEYRRGSGLARGHAEARVLLREVAAARGGEAPEEAVTRKGRELLGLRVVVDAVADGERRQVRVVLVHESHDLHDGSSDHGASRRQKALSSLKACNSRGGSLPSRVCETALELGETCA